MTCIMLKDKSTFSLSVAKINQPLSQVILIFQRNKKTLGNQKFLTSPNNNNNNKIILIFKKCNTFYNLLCNYIYLLWL